MNQTPAYKKSSFGPAFFFLPRRKREALANYYAFCRLADDIADEPSADPKQALQDLRREIQFMFIGAPRTELGIQLLRDMRQFHIPQDRFLLLLEGMQADLEKKSYTPANEQEPFEALDWYIYRVAVIVGKATLDILGLQGEKADALAQALGTAVQLTNIVRDVYEDAQLGRVYIPCRLSAEEILQIKKTGISPKSDQPDAVRMNAAVLQNVLMRCTLRAQENYRLAFELLDEFWPVTVLPCRVMGYVYQKNLAKIKKTGFAFTKSVKLNKFEKVQAVLHAIIKTLF